jgi:hypothetical protein
MKADRESHRLSFAALAIMSTAREAGDPDGRRPEILRATIDVITTRAGGGSGTPLL